VARLGGRQALQQLPDVVLLLRVVRFDVGGAAFEQFGERGTKCSDFAADAYLEFSSDPLFASVGSRSEPTEDSGERGRVRLGALRPVSDPSAMIEPCCKREMNMADGWGTQSLQR
jgi:hypothetical protein